MKTSNLSPKERLNKYSKLDDKTGCSNWTGSFSPNGYGITEDASGRPISSHRLAWTVAHRRPIPESFKGKPSVIEHVCANKACVHPGHLRLSNQAINLANPITKARKQKANGRGPALSDAERAGIHKLLDDGWKPYQISKLTGRSEPHVGKIKQAYETAKLQDAQTQLLKEINARLTDLLFPNRVKKPCGSAPAPQTGSKVRGQ